MALTATVSLDAMSKKILLQNALDEARQALNAIWKSPQIIVQTDDDET